MLINQLDLSSVIITIPLWNGSCQYGGMKLLTIFLLMLGATTSVNAQQQQKPAKTEGIASFYAHKFNGRKTFSGETFDNSAMTAAHNSLPMGTYIKVTNLRNNKWVIVKVTDRLHAANSRIVDLTQSAARKLDFFNRGLTRVKVDVVSKSFVNSMMRSIVQAAS